MTAYAVLLALLFAAEALIGEATVVIGGAGLVIVAGSLLESSYRIGVRRGVEPVPAHRAPLDALVRVQWLASGAFGLAMAATWPALIDPGTLGAAVITIAMVDSIAVVVSSLIDWYWILPRLAGIVRKAPCEQSGGRRLARLTGVWLIHRAITTLVVTGSLMGLSVYMALRSGSGTQTVWFIAAGIFAAWTARYSNASTSSLWLALNPRVRVGDLLIGEAFEEIEVFGLARTSSSPRRSAGD